MTAIYQQTTFVVACWFVSVQLCNGAIPSPETVGQLFGYPSSELLIEDNTSQERALIQTPSRLDQRRKTVLPDPAILLKAYLIHGKNKNSFSPIQVYIGKKGAFLTPEVLDLLTKDDALPVNHRAAGTEGFASLGRGGWYFTRHFKVKSDILPINIADSVVANIIVVQPYGQEFDVQIVQRLDQDLQPIPDGEAYYNTFGPSTDQKADPQLDSAKIYPELTEIVIAGWLAEKSANGVVPPSRPLPTQIPKPSEPPLDPTPNPEPAESSSSKWLWWLGILALVVLTFIVFALRERSR